MSTQIMYKDPRKLHRPNPMTSARRTDIPHACLQIQLYHAEVSVASQAKTSSSLSPPGILSLQINRNSYMVIHARIPPHVALLFRCLRTNQGAFLTIPVRSPTVDGPKSNSGDKPIPPFGFVFFFVGRIPATPCRILKLSGRPQVPASTRT